MGEREECELGDREKLREKGKECEWERGEGECGLGERKTGEECKFGEKEIEE